MKKPIATDFTYWHKGSRIKHLVYHATTQVFHAFDTSKGDLGAHFGNQQQVNNIVQNRLSGSPNGGPFIIPVWLSLENPLRLKDVGSFHADGIASQLERKGLLPKGDGKRIEKEIDQDWRLRKHYDPILITVIKNAGFDGVIYANTADGEGAGDSYIIFDSAQAVFAISNAFNSPASVKRLSKV